MWRECGMCGDYLHLFHLRGFIFFSFLSLDRSSFISWEARMRKNTWGLVLVRNYLVFQFFFKLFLTSSSFSTLRSGAPVLGEHRVPWRAVVRWPQVLWEKIFARLRSLASKKRVWEAATPKSLAMPWRDCDFGFIYGV